MWSGTLLVNCHFEEGDSDCEIDQQQSEVYGAIFFLRFKATTAKTVGHFHRRKNKVLHLTGHEKQAGPVGVPGDLNNL